MKNPASLQPIRNWKNVRVLVTGGLGFIGSNLAIRLSELGSRVTVFDNLDARCGGQAGSLRGYQEAVEIIQGDLRDAGRVTSVIKDQEVIFHCAGQTSHPYSIHEPVQDSDMNCRAMLTLLEAIRTQAPQTLFVYVASSTQIGTMQYEPVDEAHPELPLDFYSASKTICEKYALIYHHVHGLNTMAVRLPNTFGPRAIPNRKDLGFVNYFIGLVASGGEIQLFGDGHQRRNVLYVEDAVEALLAAAANPACIGQALFAAADKSCTVKELAQEIVGTFARGSIRYVDWPDERRRIEVGDAVISHERLTRLTGWRPVFSLREALSRTRAYNEHGANKTKVRS